MLKRLSYVLIFSIFFTFISISTYAANETSMVEASTEEIIVKNLSNSILSVVKWFGLAIAFGMLIYIGIKYVMSGANERANLKNIFPKYLFGLFLIVCCFLVVTAVISFLPNDDSGSIMSKADELGEKFKPSSGESDNYYSLKIQSSTYASFSVSANGEVIKNLNKIKSGTQVTLTAILNDHAQTNDKFLDKYVLVDSKGNETYLTGNNDTYTFTVDGSYTIKPIFGDTTYVPSKIKVNDEEVPTLSFKSSDNVTYGITPSEKTQLGVYVIGSDHTDLDIQIFKDVYSSNSDDSIGKINHDGGVVSSKEVNSIEYNATSGTYVINITGMDINSESGVFYAEQIKIYRFAKKDSSKNPKEEMFLSNGSIVTNSGYTEITLDLDFDNYSYAIVAAKDGYEVVDN